MPNWSSWDWLSPMLRGNDWNQWPNLSMISLVWGLWGGLGVGLRGVDAEKLKGRG